MALVAMCPYYERERGGYLYCEVCRLKFKDSVMRKHFLEKNCASENFSACPLCAETDSYYERKDKCIYEDCVEEELI